ncbi:AAA family ATPase [Planctomicrobium sp. SH661]|uniref:AAA family ATPase n=1 Tax=Planctomicrobium sp. SH661 TaxID=3448124 RepID=UPI003F5BA556
MAELPRIFSSAELAREFPELREAVIDGVLRRGEVANLVCSSKGRKSWFVEDLAISVSQGIAWIDTFPTTASKVLLVDAELHPETLASRLQRIAESRSTSLDALENLRVLPLRGQGVNLETLADALEKVMAGAGLDLLILDPSYRLMADGSDENSSKDQRGFYNRLENLADRLNCAIVLIHHATKGSQANKAVIDIGSGSGVQARAVDAHLVLRKHREANCAVLQGVLRSFEEFPPLGLRWEFPRWRKASDLDVSGLARKETSPQTPVIEKLGQLLNALREQPDTQTGLESRLKWRQGTVKPLLQTLLERGEIRQCRILKGGGMRSGFEAV